MNIIMKKVMEHSLNKEDKKFIAPHFPGGVVTPEQLRKIADACERFPEAKIKAGEIIIGGVKDEKRNDEFRKALGIDAYSVAGFCIRPVKMCAGGYICDNNLQDTYSFGVKLDKMFSGRKLPFKMIISISGCPRCCSEPLVKDIGIVASRAGYSVYIGGAAGAKPRIGQKVAENIGEKDVEILIEKIIHLYEKKGKTAERLGIFVEKMGLEKFKQECGVK